MKTRRFIQHLVVTDRGNNIGTHG